MSDQEELYIKGFNSGYLLSKHDSELYDRVVKSLDQKHDYLRGLQAGKKQHDRELLLTQLTESQKNNQRQKEA